VLKHSDGTPFKSESEAQMSLQDRKGVPGEGRAWCFDSIECYCKPKSSLIFQIKQLK